MGQTSHQQELTQLCTPSSYLRVRKEQGDLFTPRALLAMTGVASSRGLGPCPASPALIDWSVKFLQCVPVSQPCLSDCVPSVLMSLFQIKQNKQKCLHNLSLRMKATRQSLKGVSKTECVLAEPDINKVEGTNLSGIHKYGLI